MKKISTIIVTYNSEAHIYDCLDSLFKYNDIGDDLEVIVVDNCSQKFADMKDRIENKYAKSVTVISNLCNGGYGQGNNVGIKASHAPIIMIMNPDVRLVMPVFYDCWRIMNEHPRIGLLGYTQRNATGGYGRSTSWLSTINPYVAEPLRYVTGSFNLFFPKYMFFSGASFFIRKDAFVQIGMFDENIFMYGEEEDIHCRMISNGWQIEYLKSLSYQHLHRQVTDYGTESFNWLKNSLKTLLYLGEKRNEDRINVICREIKRTQFVLIVEKVRMIIGKGTKSKTIYFKGWKEYLQNLIQ